MWVVDAQDAWQMDAKHRFTYGAEYKHNFVKGTRLGEGGESGYQVTEGTLSKTASEKALHDYAGFVQDEWQISPKLYLVPALRYGWHSSFGSHVDPKLGATYEFSPAARLKANVGRGYKAPGISELYETMTRNMGGMRINVLNNPDLQPEVTTSYDISLEGEKDNNWGKITYYNNKVSDLINYRITATGHMQGDLRYYNIDKADINGVELEVGRKFAPQWQVKAVYNYLDARDSATNQRLGNRANQTAQLELIYRDKEVNPLTITLWNQWNLGYHYEWTSLGRGGMVNNYQDFTFSTLNLSAHKKWGKYSAWVGLDNIFNKKFNPTEAVPFTIEGRTWRMGAEISF
jgi:outer membrane receptor for ferrienterochelin and colicins